MAKTRIHLRSAPRSRAILAILVAASVLAGCSAGGPSESEPVPVDIGSTTFPASAPIYVAEEQGFFEDEGLEPTIHRYDAGALALADVIAGKLDFATCAETPIVRAVLDGERFKIIATVAEIDRANYIIARRDRGIREASDLVGKRIGYMPGTSGDFFRHIYLTTSRIDPERVTFVALTPENLVDALVQSEVDAVSAWPPFTTELQAILNSNAVVLDEPGLYIMAWNIVAPANPDAHPSVAQAFLRAIARANEYIASHPAEAQKITAERTGTDAHSLADLWPDLHWVTALEQSLLLSLEDEARWMIAESGSLQTTPDFLTVIDSTALRAIRPQDVDVIEPED